MIEGSTEPATAAEPGWLTVVDPTPAAPADRPVQTRRVIGQVALAALVVLAAVAVLGGVASRRVAERQSVNDAARITDLQASVVVQPALEDGLLTGAPAALDRIDRAVRARVLGPSVVRVKIWTPQGRIVYSDEPRLVGLTFPLGNDERSVLTRPKTRAEVSELQQPENRFERGRGKLLEVYRPVWTPSGSPLLFETYAPYRTVTARAGQLWRGFAGITLSSLLFLAVLLLPILWRLLDRLKRSQRQREALLRHAVEASGKERRRIAATLHDGVVQDLAASSFAVAAAAEGAAAVGQPELANALRTAAGTVRGSIAGLRSLLVDIYPPSLRNAGLTAALEDLARGVQSRGITARLDLPPYGASGLTAEQERLVFRVAQECLRNATRHSAANAVSLRLHRVDDAVVLDITDDGIGFTPSAALKSPEDGHFGLRVLADVTAEAGSALTVRSAPGAGTQWRLRMPREFQDHGSGRPRT